MEVCLFYCRPLKLVGNANMIPNGIFSIYTAFNLRSLICFDSLSLTMHGTASLQSTTQCTFIEETPKILDFDLDRDLLQDFEDLIDAEEYLTAQIPKNISDIIKANAMELSSQLVTN